MCVEDKPICSKSYAFALRIVKLEHWLTENTKDRILSKQIIRSGTSIGANVEEAYAAYSKREFVSKMQIALKEARETHYWLRLLCDGGYITKESFSSLMDDCLELLRLIGSTVKTSKLGDIDE